MVDIRVKSSKGHYLFLALYFSPFLIGEISKYIIKYHYETFDNNMRQYIPPHIILLLINWDYAQVSGRIDFLGV